MSKPKLCQIVAVVQGRKAAAEKVITEAYHLFQKEELFSGMHKTYTPKEDKEDAQPPQRKNPQFRVPDLVRKVVNELNETINVVATQDWANCKAVADIVVDGKKVISAVPVTHLLYLEKRLVDVKTFLEKMPVRDPAEDWTFNPEANLFSTAPSRRGSTKKVQEVLMKYPATEQHPAQTELITKDVVVGYWDEKKFSGATTQIEKEAALERVRKLAEAIKVAREEANALEVDKQMIGASLTDFIFGSLKDSSAS